jgi:AcrR family transcriptional regulator
MARNYHHGDLREALLDATVQIVRTGGPEAVTLRDVARRAHVSEAAPYHHFESKSHLLLEAAARGYRALGEHLAAAYAAGVTPRERLIEIGAAYVRFALDEPGYFRLLFGAHVVELVAHPAAASTKAAGQAASGYLRRAVEELHAQARARMPVLDLGRILWAQVHGLAWLVLERELRPQPSKEQALDLARGALGAIVDGVSLPTPRMVARQRRASSRATRRTAA